MKFYNGYLWIITTIITLFFINFGTGLILICATIVIFLGEIEVNELNKQFANSQQSVQDNSHRIKSGKNIGGESNSHESFQEVVSSTTATKSDDSQQNRAREAVAGKPLEESTPRCRRTTKDPADAFSIKEVKEE
jgi:hypothetical protein